MKNYNMQSFTLETSDFKKKRKETSDFKGTCIVSSHHFSWAARTLVQVTLSLKAAGWPCKSTQSSTETGNKSDGSAERAFFPWINPKKY